MNFVQPRTDILPPAQQILWPLLGQIEHGFVLYGGTAVALYHGHRQSVDFDFFGDPAFDPFQLKAKYEFLKMGEMIQTAENTLSVLVPSPQGEVKFSFFGGLKFGRAAAPSVCNDTLVRLASPLDLTVQKLKVIQVRSESKDYLDLDCLLQKGVDLAEALGAARALYPDFPVASALRAMCYFKDGDVATIPKATKKRLTKSVEKVKEVKEVPRECDQLDITRTQLKDLRKGTSLPKQRAC